MALKYELKDAPSNTAASRLGARKAQPTKCPAPVLAPCAFPSRGDVDGYGRHQFIDTSLFPSLAR